MKNITVKLIKHLRDITGVGILDCKHALMRKGTIEDAVVFLKKQGIVATSNRVNKTALQGLIAIKVNSNSAAVIEVNCETDFVSRNYLFTKLVDDLVSNITLVNTKFYGESKGSLLDNVTFFKDREKTIKQVINEHINIVNEKIFISRFAKLHIGNIFSGYLHYNKAIGVILSMTVSKIIEDSEILTRLAKNIALHIAASSPLYIDKSFIKSKKIYDEQSIFRNQAMKLGKKLNIVTKIVNRKMQTFFEQNCLLDQFFVKDPSVRIRELINKIEIKYKINISINNFVRFKIGEHI